MTTHTQHSSPVREVCAVFDRVLVGVDGSAEALEAARQASLLAAGPVTLLAGYRPAPPVMAAPAFQYLGDDADLRLSAAEALESVRDAVSALAEATGRVERGLAWDLLLQEIETGGQTLVALGAHGHGRVTGILLGSVATELIHKAPCSVLVARTAGSGFPARIVVGVDGSRESAAAYAAARSLAVRTGARVWPLVAHGGEAVDPGAVDALVGHRREDSPDAPVRALVAASADADLIVVGSRGLHGLNARSSVSERVAHEARCSVLIVRGG